MVIGELAVVLAAKTQQFVTDFGKSEKAVVAFGKKTTDIGGKLSAGLTLPLLGAATAGIALAEDLNRGMANVATLIPGNTARLEELKDSVQDVQIATGKMTDELTEGMFQVISAFGEGADTQQQFELTARAAVAGQTDLNGALALGSAVTKAYGDTSQAALGKVFDLAFKTNELGQTTFPELAAAIGRVTPLANELGVSQEQLFASMATLTGVTGNTAEVSTQLSSIMRTLLAPTDTLTELFKANGIESGKAALEQLGLQGTLKLVAGAAKETGQPLQDFLGRAEGMVATLALTDSQAAKYVSNLNGMANAAGAVDAAFEEQTAGINEVGFSMSQVSAKVTVLAQDFGDSLAPAMMFVIDNAVNPTLDALSSLVSWFQSLNPVLQGAIVTFAGILTAIGPLLIALGGIAPWLPVIKAGFIALGAAMGAVSLPVLVAVAAVGSLVAAWVFFSDEIIQFGGAVIDGFLVPAINKAIDVLNLWIAGFNSLSEMVGGPTIDALQRMDETGKTTGTRFIESMHGMNDSVSNFVGGLVDSAVPSMFDLDSKVQGVSASTGIMTGQITLADKALDRMSETSETLSKSLDKTDEAMGRIPVTLTPIPDSISAIQDASNNMKDALSSTFDQLSNKSISFGGALKSLAGTALKEIGRISGLSGKLAGLFGGGVGGGGGLLSGALGAGLSFLPGGGLLKGIGRGFGLFDEGGITTKAGFVEVGQRGVPEAHIPLSRAKEFGFGGDNGGGTTRLIVELDGEVIAEKIFDNLAIKGFD